MRVTFLFGCMALVLVFCVSSCDWKNASAPSGGVTFNITGTYALSSGAPPWDYLNIWQTGMNLRAVDDHEIVWIGTVNSTQQVYLQAQNQNTGLTEWLRGRVIPVQTLLGPMVMFEGVYTRSDNAETTSFRAMAYLDPEFWDDRAAIWPDLILTD